jgi:bifunctional UDP-N-acetylglucosamine pyrophosphorylase / glucosamine-1-phosphate N-acetyltransferase
VDDGAIVGPHSNAFSSRIGPGAHVGPFARLRHGSDIRAGARIGNFVEVKKSVVHEGTKANHLTYLGDATVGPGANIGAGTITCNYDGVAKHETKIGKGVFIGSDTALVAPVRVGDGAYVAAGSVITNNVPADALALARGRQVNKLGWARVRRRELAASKKPKESARRRPSRRPSRQKSRRKPARRSISKKRRR